MTTGEMLDITNRFNMKKIKNVYKRNKSLSELMTEMNKILYCSFEEY